ncbi:hypothetical protein MPLB_1870011 [Mesorhizobium sp. ORS 3324]|nr:hypothetical protein MPLB_1870011 [Mesorhizobium sp. ORS 3324]
MFNVTDSLARNATMTKTEDKTARCGPDYGHSPQMPATSSVRQSGYSAFQRRMRRAQQ